MLRTIGVVPTADFSRAVRVRVPAKVNLHLSVGPLRPDGYHDLVNVFHAVDLVDEVSAAPADELSLTVSGEGAATLPTDERNLAWQAAALLARTAGIAPRVHLDLRKAIPVAGGMAGGSADAAAALVACARIWDLDVTAAELSALAARLGSDGAFPLLGGTAVGTGRGEILTPVPSAKRLNWVFAVADFGISAGDAYRELDRQREAGLAPTPVGEPDRLLSALADGDVGKVAAGLINDLEPAATTLAPALRKTLDAGTRHGALAGIVSGSGPTCAFLCADAAAATLLAAALEAAGVCRTARVATGPAPGARIVQ
jgi:4-diphosphocytidyl-2-C-methyl-D-erythritol kinase